MEIHKKLHINNIYQISSIQALHICQQNYTQQKRRKIDT